MINISKKTANGTLTLIAVMAVGAVALEQPAGAVNLVTNGDFEAGATGWTVVNSEIGQLDFQRSGTWSWQTAAQNPTRGTLSQTITGLAAGQTATISFWVANSGNTPSGLDVSIGSLSLFNLSNEPPASNFPGIFFNYTTTFVVPQNNPTLLFSAFNDPAVTYVDDISIEVQASPSVSEPSSMIGLLVLSGFMLGSSRKRTGKN